MFHLRTLLEENGMWRAGAMRRQPLTQQASFGKFGKKSKWQVLRYPQQNASRCELPCSRRMLEAVYRQFDR